MAKIAVTFEVTQSDDTIERIDLHLPDGSVERLVFDGAPLVRDLDAGSECVGISHLIGKDNDTMKVAWSAGERRGSLVNFKLVRGALSTRELPSGKLVGIGFNRFTVPEA